jgi:hypothetical protein
LIVKWNGSGWADDRGSARWTQFIAYTLADVDLVVINASTSLPKISNEVRGIGTHIGNSIFDAESSRLYVANTESHNEIRFEPALKGRFQTARVSIVDLQSDDSKPNAVDLNPHVDFDLPEGSQKERNRSLALPADIARGADGALYVAAMGSAKVGVLDSAGVVQHRISVGEGSGATAALRAEPVR